MTTEPTCEAAPFKKRAKAIKERLSALGVDIKVGHAYEAQAVALGYPNWATLAAIKTQDEKAAVSINDSGDHPIHFVEKSINELITAYDYATGSSADFQYRVSRCIEEIVSGVNNPARLFGGGVDAYALPAISSDGVKSFDDQMRMAARLLFKLRSDKLIIAILAKEPWDQADIIKLFASIEMEADSVSSPTALMRRLDTELQYESLDPTLAGFADLSERYSREYAGHIRNFIGNLCWLLGEINRSKEPYGGLSASPIERSLATKLMIMCEVSPNFAEKVVRKAIRT